MGYGPPVGALVHDPRPLDWALAAQNRYGRCRGIRLRILLRNDSSVVGIQHLRGSYNNGDEHWKLSNRNIWHDTNARYPAEEVFSEATDCLPVFRRLEFTTKEKDGAHAF